MSVAAPSSWAARTRATLLSMRCRWQGVSVQWVGEPLQIEQHALDPARMLTTNKMRVER